MKKIFTFGIFLTLILGIGNNVEAATFTSRLSGITNVPIVKTYRVGLWSARATWYDLTGVADTTTLALPTYNDDVSVSVGDSVNLSVSSSYCKTLNLSGTVCMFGGSLFVNGDITVNTGGILSLKSNVYCKNLFNAGKVWAYNTNYNSAKILGIGFTNGGSGATTVASSDDITIVNDGIIGGERSLAASGAVGCGIWVTYSNQAKSLTIKHSDNVTSGFTFNAGGLYPAWNPSGLAASTAATQDFNLNIQESIALFVTASPGIFSLQNGDNFAGFNRTCTIAAGDTVFAAGKFHTTGAAPGASSLSMTYNIYGCLDQATYNRSKNEFDLYSSATSPSVTVNIKDGGTLVFGKTININQSVAGQTTAIISEPNSTVKFGYTAAAPTITATNTTFPASFYNLSIATNTNSVTLPSALRVKNALTLISGKVTLGSSNLIASSISGGSATSYVVTNGTGSLSSNAATSGTLFPIGTTTGYAPVTITPASADTVSVIVSPTPTGTFTGYDVNLNEWILTPQIATTATLAFTPTTAANTTTPVAIFSGTGYATANSATLSGSTYTASGITLAASATPFATGGTTPATAIDSKTNDNLLIYATNNSLVVKNAKVGELVTVYGVSGSKVSSTVVKGNNTTMSLLPGIYIVKAGLTVQKVSVQ